MSELEDALRQLSRAVEGMIRNSVREELAGATPDRGQRPATESEWMTDATVAERLSISRVTLAAWRATAQGPPWIKLGRLVRYKTAHVNAWLEQHTRGIPRPDRGATGNAPSTTTRSAARTTSPRWRPR